MTQYNLEPRTDWKKIYPNVDTTYDLSKIGTKTETVIRQLIDSKMPALSQAVVTRDKNNRQVISMKALDTPESKYVEKTVTIYATGRNPVMMKCHVCDTPFPTTSRTICVTCELQLNQIGVTNFETLFDSRVIGKKPHPRRAFADKVAAVATISQHWPVKEYRRNEDE